MRTSHLLPLGAALLLAACGSADGDAAAGGGDDAVTTDAVAAKVEGMIQPRPGQYQTTIELIEFDMPGMTEQAKAQMRAMMGGEMSQGNDFCLTPEEARTNGARKMMENLAESNCTFNTFEVAGGKVEADMQCKGENGMVSRVAMDGTMTSEGSAMTMTMDQEIANAGKTHMKMKVTSRRTGDCT